MEKLGVDPANFPQVEQDTEENSSDDTTAPDDDADDEDPRKRSKKIVFKPRHILTCWSDLQKLPSTSLPQFCIQPKMTDSFIDIREEGLMRILWGREAGPVAEIWGGGPNSLQWAKTQVSTSFGNLIKMLFIGDRESIRTASKQQTTYGKRTTTMDERFKEHPDIYGQGPLDRYLIDRINYHRVRHNESITTQPPSSSSSSSSAAQPPSNLPSLPTPPRGPGFFRYTLNNFIRTDGHQLQLLAYDLTKNRQASNQKHFLKRVENYCPTRQSIIDTFGEDLDSVVVVGIDPGEVVSGAFCMRINENTVVNLVVKRASLYQPTLAFRAWQEEWKRQYPYAGPVDNIHTDLWTRKGDGDERPTSLPSLNDLQNALPPTAYESWDSLVFAHKRYLELEPIIHGFYASSEWKRAAHQHKMAKLSEMDLAVAGVLRMVDEALEEIPVNDRRVFFALGNGKFRTGLNLTSLHTTFLRRLLQKVTEVMEMSRDVRDIICNVEIPRR